MKEFDNLNVNHNLAFVTSTAEVKLWSYFNHKWYLDINREQASRGQGRNKLRTYKLFKY